MGLTSVRDCQACYFAFFYLQEEVEVQICVLMGSFKENMWKQ